MVKERAKLPWVLFVIANPAMHSCSTPRPAPVLHSTVAQPSPPPVQRVLEGPRQPGCFDSPVVEVMGQEFEPKPLDPNLTSTLERCPSARDPVECEYAVARAYFEANRFELAGPIFRRIATAPQAGGAGPNAALMVLECLNVLASQTEPPRTACYDEMATDVPRFLSIHCGSGERHNPDELCPMLRQLDVDIARLRAEKWVKEGDRMATADSASLYRLGAESYWAVFASRCRLDAWGRNLEGEVPLAGYRCDELAYNAYMAFRAAGDATQAGVARDALLDPKNKLTGTLLAKRAAEQP